MLAIEIQKRIVPAADGSSSLLVFDGAVQSSIMYPSRISEIVHGLRCKTTGKCVSPASGFDSDVPNLAIDENLQVRQLEDMKQHVFAKADISFPSYLGLDTIAVSPIHVSPLSYKISQMMATKYNGWKSKSLVSLNEQYFHIANDQGRPEAIIPSSIHLFINYGCGGNYNIGNRLPQLSETETDSESASVGTSRVYNPAADRQSSIVSLAAPLRPLQKGEEILKNDNVLVGLSGVWKENVFAITQKCSSTKA